MFRYSVRMSGCTIRGTVKDVSGAPVRKAEIELSTGTMDTQTHYVATSGPDGSFSIQDVEPGQYHMRVQRTGYVAGNWGGIPGGAPLTVAPDRELGNIALTLVPQAVIVGRVLDEDGDPLEQVQVMVQPASPGSPSRRNAATDDEGRFRISGVAPGSYVLSASQQRRHHPHGRWILQGVAASYPDVYYPDVFDPAEAQPIRVNMGATVSGFELRMKKVAAYRVSGSVELPRDAAAASVFVHVHPRLGPGWVGSGFGGALRAAGENFDLSAVLPGSYTLIATCNDGQRSRQASLPIDVQDRDLEGLVVRFPSGATIDGVLLGAGDLAGIHIALTPNPPVPGPSAQTAAGGKFTFYDVVPGIYQLRPWRIPRDGYVRGARLNGVPTSPDAIAVNGPGQLEVEIAFDGGVIAGIVESAEATPLQGAAVQLWSASQIRHFAVSDQDGRFEIRGVAPGDLVAIAARSPLELRPERRESGTAVTVGPNGRTTVRLKVL
jgi:hypothetical protein